MKRWLSFLVLGALAAPLLVGCGRGQEDGAPTAPPAPGGSDGASASVAFARSLLNGEAPPGPGAFQQRLLDKAVLTYADYESAMQAMGQCVQDRAPGATITLTPSQLEPQMFDIAMQFGGNGAPRATAVPESGVGPSDSVTQDSSDDGSANKPAIVVSLARTEGECLLTYSAFVEDKWRQQLVLDAQQVTVQKPQFIECMTAAGVQFPKDQSNATLKKFLQSPGWYAPLTKEQNAQATQCLTQFATFVNTIGQ